MVKALFIVADDVQSSASRLFTRIHATPSIPFQATAFFQPAPLLLILYDVFKIHNLKKGMGWSMGKLVIATRLVNILRLRERRFERLFARKNFSQDKRDTGFAGFCFMFN